MSQVWKTRVATLGVLSAIFLAGTLVGAAVDRSAVASVPTLGKGKAKGGGDSAAAVDRDAERGGDRDGARGGARWIIDRVDLTPEQRVQADSVLDYHRARMNALAEAYHEAYWPVVDATREGLRKLLTDEQRARYDALLSENDARRGRNGN
jgi:Spy/CpxP family protein refolding chaperone